LNSAHLLTANTSNMKKIVITLILINAIFLTGNAQMFITKNGKVSFYSDGSLEKIEAYNTQVNSAINITTGQFVFKVLMKSFSFEKALMQEHFNENYVESDKFPNATFQGLVANLNDVDFSALGTYDAIIEGDLTIHGIKNKVKEIGTFEVKEGGIIGSATFFVKLADYDISIPGAVTGKIAEDIEISVDVDLKPRPTN
jgi:polyisoprenoid-binding protein YceI